MPTDWKARFEAMVEELRNNPLIEFDEGPEFGDPATDEAIAAAKEFCGGRLPDGIEDLYRSLGSFRLVWKTKEAYPYPEKNAEPGRRYGFIRFPEIGYVFTSNEGSIWFDFLGENHPFRKVFAFCDLSEEATAALYPVPGDASIHYHYLGEDLWPTGLGVNAYLELLLHCRGYWYWLKTCTNMGDNTREPGWFRDMAPKLFPDLDVSRFKPRTSEGEVDLSIDE
jgi:hypothetical protein